MHNFGEEKNKPEKNLKNNSQEKYTSVSIEKIILSSKVWSPGAF